jgi:ABC-type transport system involved in multi-copper enzyme maturation permease subunit
MVAKELRNVWWMLALGVLIFLPVLISGPTPYAQLVEISKTDNVFLDMQVPSMFEEDTGVPKDPVLFAAEEMALFFGAVGKTFLIPLAAVLGVGLVSAEAGRSTILLLLSKPVGRDRVLLTKWAVGAVALLGIVAFFGTAFVVSAAAKGYPLDLLSVTSIGLSILLLWLGSLSVFGLALAISILMRNLVWSAIAILTLMVLTWAFSSFLYGFWMNYFLDDGESLRLSAEVVQRAIIPYYWSSKDLYLGDSFALVNFTVCLLVAALTLLAALWAFRRRAF